MRDDDPRHGSYAGYVAHKKAHTDACLPCATAARRFRKQANVEAHRGEPRTVPLGDAAWRIITVTTPQQLSRQGVPLATIFRLRRLGPETIVRRRTRDAILAAKLPTAIGVQRRLRALSRLGWSMRALAAEMGSEFSDNLRSLLAKENVVYVREPMSNAIVAAYERLHMQPAPEGRGASRARNRAIALGWAPPLAFDNIDDPDEQPTDWEYREVTARDIYREPGVDPVVVMRLLEGDQVVANTAERRAAMAQWCADGGSERELCLMHGWKPGRYGTRLKLVEEAS